MNNKKMLRLGILLMIGFTLIQQQRVEASSPLGVNFQVFYNELSPYGDWVMDPTYGYLWIPNVGPDFHPYATNGNWTMTNFGNTWVSNYNWGWAPFHYGRWFYDNFYGWAWVPDYEWGPAWVSWRSGGGYYGWAPLSPGLGIHVSVHLPRAHWVFIPQRRFGHRNFHRYFVPNYQVVNMINHTTVINNTYVYNNRSYVAGPDRRDIERVTRRAVPVYQVKDTNQPGRASLRNNTLAVYRPEVKREVSPQNQPRPSRAFTSEEYKGRSAQTRTSAPANRNAIRETSPSNSSTIVRSRNAVDQQSDATNTRSTRSIQNRVGTSNPQYNNQQQARPVNLNVSRQAATPNRNQSVSPRNQESPRSSVNRTNTSPRSTVGAQPNRTRETQRVSPARNNAPNRSAVRTAPSRNSSGQQVRSSTSRSPSGTSAPPSRSSSSRSSGSRGNN